MNTKLISKNISLSVVEQVDQLGHGNSGGSCVGINQALEQETHRTRLTLEAMTDVDSQIVIDHQVVLMWLDSLVTRC
jgi:hypothetical protein